MAGPFPVLPLAPWLFMWMRRVVGPLLFLVAPILVATAAQAADPVKVKATSPAYTGVGVVPDSVSVTFTGSIKDDGASVTVTGPGGREFGVRREVVDNTLREFLAPGPAGPYSVVWAATGKGGEKLSGSFSFVAAQPHAGYAVPSPVPSSSASPSPGPSPSASPSPSPSPSPAPSPASSPAPSASRSPGPAEPTAGTPSAVSGGSGGSGADDGGHASDVPRIVIPAGVALLLVAASVLIAAANRRRRITEG